MPDLWVDVDVPVIVPVNLLPLLDDTDFKTIETAVVYNSPGLALTWNFQTAAGVLTGTAVTPTTAGVYDWSEPLADKGMYGIEMPASGGASINNDTEGVGWFTGVATGILPWRGPTIGFRAAGLNDKLMDSAYSATRGLAGTAVPDAAADAIGGLPISDAGGLDLDSKLANTNEVTAARMGALTDWINGGRLDLIIDAIAAGMSLEASLQALIATVGAAGAGLTALGDARLANLNATIASRMATYAQPAGFLAATFPADPADQSLIIAATDAIITAIGTLNNLSQANIRTALGLGTANLDTQLGDLPTNAESAAAFLIVTNAITALNNLAAGAAMTLTVAERKAIADAWTGRNIAGGTDGGRTNGEAMAPLRNRVVIALDGTVTVYATDDTAVLWTGVAVRTPGDPISSIDPT